MAEKLTQSKPSIHLATYRLLKQLMQEMDPIAKLAAQAEAPDQPHPMTAVITLLQHLTEGVERILTRLETLEARLDEATAAKAIKDAVRS